MDQEHDVMCDSITIARCREILGDEAVGLSGVEVDQMRRHAEVMAHLIVDIFLEQQTAQE
jgi:hypothetical protein